jgi:putative salt-induced outer membrane protein YdiY
MQVLVLAAALVAAAVVESVGGSGIAVPAAALQEPEVPLDEWTGTVSLFGIYTGGNSKSEGFGGSANAQYRREKDRTTLQFFYDKRFSEGSRTVDKRFADGKYDYFISDKTYWWGKARFDVDREADLKLQSLASTGLGRQFAESEVWKLNGEAGVSYIDQDFDGSAADDDFIALRFGANADYNPSERWGISNSTDYFPSLEDSDAWYVVANTKAKLAFTESMSGSLTYLFTHQETPPAGNEQDDHNLLLGLDWNF